MSVEGSNIWSFLPVRSKLEIEQYLRLANHLYPYCLLTWWCGSRYHAPIPHSYKLSYSNLYPDINKDLGKSRLGSELNYRGKLGSPCERRLVKISKISTWQTLKSEHDIVRSSDEQKKLKHTSSKIAKRILHTTCMHELRLS